MSVPTFPCGSERAVPDHRAPPGMPATAAVVVASVVAGGSRGRRQARMLH